ncbi:TIGR04104 family putative zinc finger protein [Clostridium paridis]|uniref:Cxxc_20_cxxc protein n=1 Tax=Clostridium paridis TaxID=2803863 RepID=A0A937FK83_9CLOT|nr:hypothetical protein [Clostridium paridis]
MLIQKCKKCSKSFKWSTILKASWSWNGFKPIECENCKTKHYYKPINRIIIFILAFTPLIFENAILGLPLPYGIRSYIFWVYPAWAILLMLLSPFFTRFYIKE